MKQVWQPGIELKLPNDVVAQPAGRNRPVAAMHDRRTADAPTQPQGAKRHIHAIRTHALPDQDRSVAPRLLMLVCRSFTEATSESAPLHFLV